jgi:predicted DCC family thiol-disulfide oxidoreductase YuxK
LDKTQLAASVMIILFDGVCNLCNGFVQFILRHDRKGKFRFASLQSPYGIELRQHFGIHASHPDTVLLFDGRHIYSQAEAVLKILTGLSGFYKFFLVFKILPGKILNSLYDFIARHRYKWFGKRNSCYLPSEDISSKFLDNQPFALY